MPGASDGRYLQATPVIAWSPKGGPNGELLLSAHHEIRVAGGAPEDQAVVLLNTSSGSGSWNWMPAPIAVPTDGAPSNCGTNYSPDLLVSADGTSVRYTAAGVAGPYNCEELTGSANTGFLVRATDPTTGTDSVNGYYVGVTNSSVVSGKENYGWTQLATSLDRAEFYAACKSPEVVVAVATGDTRYFANVLLTIGALPQAPVGEL